MSKIALATLLYSPQDLLYGAFCLVQVPGKLCPHLPPKRFVPFHRNNMRHKNAESKPLASPTKVSLQHLKLYDILTVPKDMCMGGPEPEASRQLLGHGYGMFFIFDHECGHQRPKRPGARRKNRTETRSSGQLHDEQESLLSGPQHVYPYSTI